MIACDACGRENPDEARFCGSCGGRLAVAPAPAPEDGPEPEPPAVAPAEPPSEDQPPETEAQRRLRALVARGPTPEPAPPRPAAPASAPPTVPASGPLPPPAAPASAARPAAQPEAMKPGAPAPKAGIPGPAAPAPAAIRPGDIVCGECGTGNDPERRFCRRCGTSLAQAVAPTAVRKVPWWRRLFPRRAAAVSAAGDRPMRGRGSRVGRVFRRVAAVLVGVALVAVAGPWRSAVSDRISSTARSVRRTISVTYAPARPTAATASSTLAGHGPEAAIDGVSNSAWSEGVAGEGVGQQLTLTFGGPVDVDRVGITPGASVVPAEFLAQPRPREVRLTFTDGTIANLTLKDQPGFQAFAVKARRVVSVVLEIRSVYPSAAGGQDASVAEIELFTKS